MSIDKNKNTLTNGEKIGEYTKYQREKLGETLTSFARKTHTTPSFLLRLEQGAYQGVSIDVINKLSRGFNMTIVEFLKKSGITSYEKKLPSLEFFMKETYQFPPDAIEDIKLFVSFLKKKYSSEIKTMKQKHKKYWQVKK